MPEETQGVRPMLAPQFPSAQPTQPAPPGAPPRKSNAVLWIVLGCGGGLMALMMLGVLVGLMLPAVAKVRENARRAQCKSNLRQIGLACHIYADDNDEEFPPDLAHLYPDLVDNPRLFSCPSQPASDQDFTLGAGAVTEGSSSYVRLPGRWPALPGDFILAYEKLEDHRQGFNVLYADAHVAWIPASGLAQFRAQLADQDARLPELRKQREAGKKAGTTKGAP